MSPDRYLSIQLIGGPTLVIEYGGTRLVTDPTFDAPRSYHVGGRTLTKLTPPAVVLEDIGMVDAVLLSHHQHPDNLDHLGSQWLKQQKNVWTTEAAHQAKFGALLPVWQTVELPEPSRIRITGLPARHGPVGCERLTGEVMGFLLEGEHLPAVYISGDNASLEVVSAIAARYPAIDVAILFCGAAQTALCDHQNLTLNSDQAVEAAHLLGAPIVVPVHFEGWSHFTEGAAPLRRAFEHTHQRLYLLECGEIFQMPAPHP